MTQATQILNHLKQGHSLTPMEALNLCGCWRLADVVYKLKNKGHNIETTLIKKNGKTFAEYKLKREYTQLTMDELTVDEFEDSRADIVIYTVAEYFGIPANEIRDKNKQTGVVEPRQIAQYIMRNLKSNHPKLTYQKIGDMTGCYNHATVMHSCRLIEAGGYHYGIYDDLIEIIMSAVNDKLSILEEYC